MRVCAYCGYEAANATNLRVHLKMTQYRSRNLAVQAERKGRAGNKLWSICTSVSRTVLLTRCLEPRHPRWEPLAPTHCKDVVPSPQTPSDSVSTMVLHSQAPVRNFEHLISTRDWRWYTAHMLMSTQEVELNRSSSRALDDLALQIEQLQGSDQDLRDLLKCGRFCTYATIPGHVQSLWQSLHPAYRARLGLLAVR